MLPAQAIYRRSVLLPLLVLVSSVVLAIGIQEPWYMLVAFVWILAPLVFNWVVTNTEQLFWLLLISLPISTELNITPSLGLDFPDEICMMLLTGLTVIKLVHQPKWFPRSLLTHPLFFVVIIYLCWLLLSCMYSVEPVLSVKFLLAKTWYIIPFVVLPQILLLSKNRLQKMAVCLLLPMLLVVIQVLIRESFYAFSFAMLKKTMAPFFRNHVNYSSMLVCLLPISWCVWKLMPADHPKKKWVAYGIAIGLLGLLFAYSRGAWIALPAGFAVGWIIQKKWIGRLTVIAGLLIVIAITWLATDKNFMRFTPDHDRTYYHTNFGEHLLATVNGKDISAAERFYRWVAGARMIAEKPVTGFGPNAFYLHYRPYTVSRFQTWVSDNPEHSTVHNYFLLVALEQGMIGLVLFCLIYFGMLINIQRLYHRLQSVFYKTVAITTGIILTMIGVINCMSDMIETDKIGSLFWLCLGMVILLERELKEERLVMAKIF